MITQINATDRLGNTLEYMVRQETIEVNGIPGMRYMISLPDLKSWKFFEIQALEVSPNRIMMYMLLNHDHPELTGKGIVKAMIQVLSTEFQKDIVSSTRIEELQVSKSEGRIDDMTRAWEKWKTEFDNIEYLESEDRYIFLYVENN